MSTIIYKIDLFTHWHAGSGLYGGTNANLTVIRNQAGLPFIPGKTLKGLIREGAEAINSLIPDLVTNQFIDTIFGQEDKVHSICFFSNAELSRKFSENVRDKQKQYLYTTIASTAIDAMGMAKDQSLRQMEVTLPLVLYGSIEHFPNIPGYEMQLSYCLQWIKKLGHRRTRGFGRCELSIYQPQSNL